jgi:A/G-specific adenine glycosylase
LSLLPAAPPNLAAPAAPSQTAADDARAALDAILVWWDAHQRPLAWRQTRDVYAVWVAEVMSAQTQVDRAAAVWRRWMERWPTVESLAAASLAEVLLLWQGLGYPRRARDLYRAAKVVAASGWPEPLRQLPGIGPYTEAAIRCFAREEPVLPRDVNVNRVLARRFPDGVDPSADPWRIGQALMEFGQRWCVARPDCTDCPAAAGCPGPGPDLRAARPRRHRPPYPGSLRMRRGRLLAAVLQDGRMPLAAADPQAAETLTRDGLLRRDGDCLVPPA